MLGNQILVHLKPWLSWLHLHPQWVAILTFLVAFIECLAVVGLLVPGTVMMTAIGALVGSDVVSVGVVFIPAILGAIVGDAISFGIGAYYHEHLRDIWPFRTYPRLLQKGETFFYRHGGKGIFLGRFIGPIRPVLPIIAGMLKMPVIRFFGADIISAIFWAPLYMLPGILLGAASVELAPGVAMHLMLYVILALLVLWCISWGIKSVIAWVFSQIHQLLDRMWAVIKHHRWLRPISIALQDPLSPDSHAQLTLALYLIFIMGLLFLVTVSVLHHGIFTTWNMPLLFLLRSLHTHTLDKFLLMVTLIAKPTIQFMVFWIMLGWFIYQRTWRTAGHWLLLGIFCFIGGELLKAGVHSPRPEGLLVTPSGYSFPSGHTTVTTALVGWLAFLTAREVKKNWRWLPYTLAVMAVLLVAISRLYLGAHWLTDIIGGILLGLMSIMLVILSYRRHLTPRLPIVRLWQVFLASWLIIGTTYAFTHYRQATYDYTLYVPQKISTLQAWWQQNGQPEPLYRLNRTGKPTQIFNVQWVGELNSIESSLFMRGWQAFPNTPLTLLLQRLSRQTTTVELPVLPQLYLNQRAALIMTKKLPVPHTLLVLMLWDSHTLFSDSDLSLWLGNVSYYHISQTGKLHLHTDFIILPGQSPLQMLETDLPNFNWKQVSYQGALPEYLKNVPWDRQLLLVKPAQSGEGN